MWTKQTSRLQVILYLSFQLFWPFLPLSQTKFRLPFSRLNLFFFYRFVCLWQLVSATGFSTDDSYWFESVLEFHNGISWPLRVWTSHWQMQSCRNGAGIKKIFLDIFLNFVQQRFPIYGKQEIFRIRWLFPTLLFFIFLIDCFVEPIFKGIIMELTHRYKKKLFHQYCLQRNVNCILQQV